MIAHREEMYSTSWLQGKRDKAIIDCNILAPELISEFSTRYLYGAYRLTSEIFIVYRFPNRYGVAVVKLSGFYRVMLEEEWIPFDACTPGPHHELCGATFTDPTRVDLHLLKIHRLAPLPGRPVPRSFHYPVTLNIPPAP